MTYGQLYREIWMELHPGKVIDKASFKHADSVVPSGINEEIPQALVEPLRKVFLEQARQIDAQTDEENNKALNKYLEKN